jgi:hypothetical protein
MTAGRTRPTKGTKMEGKKEVSAKNRFNIAKVL